MKYLAVLVLVNGISYIASIVMSHLYNPEFFGLLMSYIAIGNIIALISCLGIPEYSLRELSLNNKKISFSALILSLTVSLFLSFIWPLPFDALKLVIFFVSIASVVVSYICVVLKFKYRAVELALIQKIVNVFKIILLVITVLVFYLEPTRVNSVLAVSITNFVLLFFIVIFFAFHIKKYKLLYHFNFRSLGVKKEALLFFVNEISFFFSYQAAILIMGQRGWLTEVANYSLAILIMSACGLLINAIFNSMLLSDFYKLFTVNAKASFTHIEKFLKVALIVCLPLAITLYICIEFIYPMIFDLEKYPELVSLTQLFILPILIKLIYSPLGMAMNLKETIVYKNKVLVSVGLFTFIATYLLSDFYGSKGALFAFTISEVIILIAYIIAYAKLKANYIDITS